MSLLNPNYPIMEIAISLVNYSPLESGHERVLVGDVVAIRKASSGVGRKEVEEFLWLRVEGLEEDEFARLSDLVVDSTSGIIYDKRRYCIPLEKLKEVELDFDVDLALTYDRIYQPFLLVDYDEDYSFVLEDGDLPLQVSGLVYDKVTGEYL